MSVFIWIAVFLASAAVLGGFWLYESLSERGRKVFVGFLTVGLLLAASWGLAISIIALLVWVVVNVPLWILLSVLALIIIAINRKAIWSLLKKVGAWIVKGSHYAKP